MNRHQTVALAGACGIFLVLLFGFDIKSPDQTREIAQREKTGLALDLTAILKQAGEKLAPQEAVELARLEASFQQVEEAEHANVLKEISGFWFRQKEYYLAGSFAEQVAELLETAEAWGIAGTTYLAGISEAPPERKQACLSKAVESLDNAISLAPEQVEYRVNKALAYVKAPPEGNPMQGIQMLLRLEERFPESAVVLINLAKLAVETGQFERAKQRLESAALLEPDSPRIVCLLADVLAQLGDPEGAAWKEKCNLLTE